MYNQFTIYFYLYFIFGILIVILLYVKSNFSEFCNFFNLKFYAKNFSIKKKHIEKIITVCFIFILFSSLWPILIIMLLYSLYDDWRWKRQNKKNEFQLNLSNLIEKIDKSEIEIRETVFDPLNAAPAIPFGHLNNVWLEFCSQLDPLDELWTFDVTRDLPWGGKERYFGYVSVHQGKINMSSLFML